MRSWPIILGSTAALLGALSMVSCGGGSDTSMGTTTSGFRRHLAGVEHQQREQPVQRIERRPASRQRLGHRVQPARLRLGRQQRHLDVDALRRQRRPAVARRLDPGRQGRPGQTDRHRVQRLAGVHGHARPASAAPAPSSSPARAARSPAGRPPSNRPTPSSPSTTARRERSTRAWRIASVAGAPTSCTRPTSTTAASTCSTPTSRRSSASGGFVDPTLPAGYAPFGIQAIGGRVYVSYAKQDAQAAGRGRRHRPRRRRRLRHRPATSFRRLVAAGGALDAPWGMAMAPAAFGAVRQRPAGRQFRRRQDQRLRPATGAFLGTLRRRQRHSAASSTVCGDSHSATASIAADQHPVLCGGAGRRANGVYGRIDFH